MPACTPRQQAVIGLGLATLMAATRFHHLGDALHLPDASWAVYFLAGFYLAPVWLFGLLAEAVVIDYVAIEWLGTSAFCVTPAYVALLPAYASLWLGGRWLAGHLETGGWGWARLLGVGAVSASVAFLISNASFYWFGGQVDQPGLAAYAVHFLRYFPGFVGTTLLYLVPAAAVHALVVRLEERRRGALR